MLESFKAIAAYVFVLRGVVNWSAKDLMHMADRLRKAVDRPAKRNPLPVIWEGGRAKQYQSIIRAWNDLEIGRRARRSSKDSLAA